MTRDFLKPQKTTGLDTNAPAGKRSRFAPDPFPKPVQAKPQQPDLQTLIQRGLRLGDPMAKAWGDLSPTVDSANQPSVQAKQEQPDLQTLIQRGLRLGDPMAKAWANSSPEVHSGSQPSVQTKLTVGQRGDKYEKEADEMASQVMSMPEPDIGVSVQSQELTEPAQETKQNPSLTHSIIPLLQTQAGGNTQPNGEQSTQANSSLETQLTHTGSGSPLSDEVQSFMGSRFGADFSQVRVHTGSNAIQMNQELGAQAFTHGNDIYFGQGQYPGKNDLTAHELTHTIQQTSGSGLRVQGFFWDNDENEKESDSDSSGGLFDWVSDAASSVTDTASSAWDKATDFTSDTWDTTKDTASDVWSGVTDTASNVADTASNTWDTASDFASDTWDTTKDTASDVWSGVTNTASSVADTASNTWDKATDIDTIHTTLDAVGFLPYIGAVADLANAGLYAARGDWSNAALSGVAAVPGIGDAVGLAGKGAKAASKFIPKAGKTISKGNKAIQSGSKTFGNKIGKVGKNLEDIHQRFENPLTKSVLKGPAKLVGEYTANTLVKGEGAKAWLKKTALEKGTIQGIKQGAGAIFGEFGESIAGGIQGETNKRKLQRITDTKTWDDVANVTSDTWNTTQDMISNTWDEVEGTTSDTWDKASDFTSDIWNTILESTSNIWDENKEKKDDRK